jgi:hypothetical protein
MERYGLMACRHCMEARHIVCRGLCGRCYYTPEIRERYPAGCAGYGLCVANEILGWPREPTEALPGTEEKVAVMEARVAAGCHLHHPGDAKPWEE